MVRKFIVDSAVHWVTDYHIDGFRFDLMGIHDIETMNALSESLHAIDPTIYLYGEGWTARESPLPENRRSLKKYTRRLNRVAAFSDDLRDGIKGSVFEPQDRGFASGKPEMEECVKFGVVAATQHPQIDYRKVNYSKKSWAGQPAQCVNYVSCHDNHTLWDRLQNSNPDASEVDRIRMDKLAQAIVLTSQGVPFLHAGAEMLRTKAGAENSYNQPDAINQIDWTRKDRYREVFDYYRDLIALRRNHPAFRMPTTESIQRNLRFLEKMPEMVVGYELNGRAVGDSWPRIVVLFNGSMEDRRVKIPNGDWMVVVDGNGVNEQGIRNNPSQTLAEVTASSAQILVDR